MIKPQTGDEADNSVESQFLQYFIVAEAKIGKTTGIACNILGAFPDQPCGLVSSPECLHIIAFDENAIQGLRKFIVDACKRPDCTKYTVWDMSKIARDAIMGEGYDASLLNNIVAIHQEINKRCMADTSKVHAVLTSSFTGMGMALKASIAGKPTANNAGKIMSSGMNQTKWDILNADLMTVRAIAHTPVKHCFWEGHVQEKFKAPEEGQSKTTTEETVGVPGGEGRNWAANVSEVSRLRREAVKHPNTSIDKVSFDTRPSADFISGGRGFNDLAPKETDIAVIARKLGKKVGGYKKP